MERKTYPEDNLKAGYHLELGGPGVLARMDLGGGFGADIKTARV